MIPTKLSNVPITLTGICISLPLWKSMLWTKKKKKKQNKTKILDNGWVVTSVVVYVPEGGLWGGGWWWEGSHQKPEWRYRRENSVEGEKCGTHASTSPPFSPLSQSPSNSDLSSASAPPPLSHSSLLLRHRTCASPPPSS